MIPEEIPINQGMSDYRKDGLKDEAASIRSSKGATGATQESGGSNLRAMSMAKGSR